MRGRPRIPEDQKKTWREWYRERVKTEPKYASRRKAKWRAQHPEYERIRDRVRYALQTGRLAKHACFTCGAEKVQAHHSAYSLPLAVVWLCQDCHVAAHEMVRHAQEGNE